ncbi:MAG TPA: hypothetical protein VHE54_08325 [Puia sp.]|nr:hypothetical protein [Puia sp.]
MKPALFLFTSLLSCSIAYSQAANDEMAQDFKDVSKFGSRQSGFEGLQTYHSGNVEGSQFFSPNWTTGTVTTVTNQQFGKNYLFLYDKVRQELFMKPKDSSVVLLADKDLIGAFTLVTDKVHSFVPASAYDPSNAGNFFEVLVKDDKGYSLYKLIKTKFVKADERDMEKQAQGEVFDSFQDQITYYLIKDGRTKTVALRKNNILKVLTPVKSKASQYFDQNSDRNLDEGMLIGIIQYING